MPRSRVLTTRPVRRPGRSGDLAEVERLRAEAEVSAQRFRDLVQGLDAVVWEADAATGKLAFVSQHVEKMLGYSAERCMSEPNFWDKLVHPDDREQVVLLCREATPERREYEIEYRMLAADGRTVWVHDNRGVVRDAQGRPQLLRGVLVDITADKRAEEARTKLTAVIEATSDFVGIADVRGRELYINRAGRKMLGIAEDEDLSTMRAADHQPAWARGIVQKQGIPTARREGAWSGETALLSRDGKEIPISQVILAHKAASGEIDFFATIARDISERKQAEARMAGLLEIARDISGRLDLHEVLDRVQRRTASLVPCERVITYYWDAARNAFREIARYGLPDQLEHEAALVEFRPGQPIVDLLTSGQTAVVNDIADQSLVPLDILARFGISALIAAPMAVRGRILGALVAVNAESGRRFEGRQVQLLESIAHHLAVAIEATELYRSQREEAHIAAALARVGREMISVLDTPVILDRLCQLTTEVLECDCSHTLLWKPEEDAYVPVSGHGYPAEQWESIRLMKLPRAVLAPGLARLERVAVANVTVSAFQHLVTAKLASEYGITRALNAALRRGGEIIGMLVACDRGPQEPFTRQQERIAEGIAQLASLALENARLVEEVGRASRLKSDFVATMSHELRTPLNVIVGYNNLLLDGTFGELTNEQTETLRRIEKSAQELLELINATLDVSRLETGRLPPELQEVCVPELINEIAGETRDLQEKPGLRFVWQVPTDLPRLRTDPVKLKVVLKNLIGNAAKFTDQGMVTVAVCREGDHFEFRVTDTGIGIAPEARGVIFEPFRQADSSTTRRYGGVGLGLYIVRRLLEILGGTITLDSEVGRGSTFRVMLPDAPAA